MPRTMISAATPGLTRLAAALAGGGQSAFQRARQDEQLVQSRIAQALGSIEASQATADAARARGRQDDVETGILERRPQTIDEALAAQANTDLPTVTAWRNQIRTGRPSMTSATGDADTDAAIGIAPQPVVSTQVAQALARLAPRMLPFLTNKGDITPDSLARAADIYRDSDLSDSVIAGAIPRGTVAGAQAAAGGKPLFSQSTNGSVLDLFAGTVDQSNPIARSVVAENQAQAGQASAAAGLSGARRARVEGGFDRPVTVVDDDTGEATITRMPTRGEPVSVGTAPKKGTGVDATNAKERNRVVRDVERDMPGATDAEINAEVDRRMARRGAKPGAAPAPAPTPAPSIDMNKANQIKAQVRAGTLTREQGVAQLRALGFK